MFCRRCTLMDIKRGGGLGAMGWLGSAFKGKIWPAHDAFVKCQSRNVILRFNTFDLLQIQ